jgi:GntR family transcriptional regulator/MocR family aminotransferase
MLQSCAQQQLSGALTLTHIEAGLQIAGTFEVSTSREAVARAAAERGLELTPLSRYARRPLPNDGLLLDFSAVDERTIARGVEQLALVLERFARPRR